MLEDVEKVSGEKSSHALLIQWDCVLDMEMTLLVRSRDLFSVT